MKPGNADREPMFAARFAAMVMRRVHLDNPNLALIEMSIRRIATGHRKDAERWPDPALRARAIACAEELELIAERMRRCREASAA